MSGVVAIVGAGPAGFYCANALVKRAPWLAIDLLDRLPTPYGLVRTGVAPDHASTKRVSRVFDRIAEHENVRFVGNVEIDRDIRVAELLHLYDVVVLATGVARDRRLGIEGEDLPGVFGSGQITRWYNGHPYESHLDPALVGPSIAVIGVGNVAVDIARVLALTEDELARTDLPPYALTSIGRAGARDIYMFGRRGPMEAAFTPVELRELGELERAYPVVQPAQLPSAAYALDPKQLRLKEKILDTLRSFEKIDPDGRTCRIHLCFYSSPVRFVGTSRVEAVELAITEVVDGRARPTGETYQVPANTVVTCIGYMADALQGVPVAKSGTRYANEGGKIAERLYVVGWAKRGPSGVIATNRGDSVEVVERILAQLIPSARAGRAGLDALARERGLSLTTFQDWKHLDALERERANPPAPRAKFTSVDAMLEEISRSPDASRSG